MKNQHIRISVSSLVVFCGVCLACVPLSAMAQPGKGKGHADVQLLANVESVVPGTPFDIGLRIRLDDGWHTYWKNSGDSGLPPRTSWTLPAEFEVGEFEHPVPKRKIEAGFLVTHVHEGEPMLIARVTPPASIADSTVSLKAHVVYLICEKNCIRKTTDLSLELPVQQNGKAKPANEEVFARARRTFPKTASKYLSIKPKLSDIPTSPGQKFVLELNVRIGKGYHIQSHEPLRAGLIACDLFLENSAGIFFEEAVYPPPKIRTVKTLGKLSEYEGRITITVPAEVDEEADPSKAKFAGILKYQACNNKGTCFPPEALAFSLDPNAPQGAQVGSATIAEPSIEEKSNTVANAQDSNEESTVAEAPGESTATADSVEDTDDENEKAGIEAFLEGLGLPGLLLGCFLYGLFINATPCVLPILSIKVLGFVQQAHESRGKTLMLGLAFGAGVMIFFVVLGFLAAAGKNILGYPAAVIGLGAVVTALALSMLGVYTLQVPAAATKLDATIQTEGVFASFGKGALAPVLGFACTGPLLAGAFGWATQQEPQIAFLAFLVTGLGMASPYMLLGANPNWLSFLPRPGNWMITFERIMGFLLLAMVLWLIHPLVQQIGSTGHEWTLGFFVAIGMACWVWGKIDINMAPAQRWRYRGSATAIVAFTGLLVYGWIYPLGDAVASQNLALVASSADSKDWSKKIPWRRWTQTAVEEAATDGQIVFVDFTAAYCTVCKANKAVATNTPEVRAKMVALDVVPFQGDFTGNDPEIFEVLKANTRAGVPLNLIYPAGRPNDPIVLRPNLTKAYLLKKLDEAAARSIRSTN